MSNVDAAPELLAALSSPPLPAEVDEVDVEVDDAAPELLDEGA